MFDAFAPEAAPSGVMRREATRSRRIADKRRPGYRVATKKSLGNGRRTVPSASAG